MTKEDIIEAIPQTARAAIMTAYGRPLEIADVAVPQELEPNALLVKITASTICGSDVHALAQSPGAGFESADSFPRILGHEMTGRIVAMGEGAYTDTFGRKLAIGDRVIWTHGFCGRCRFCALEGIPTLCLNRRLYTLSRATDHPYLVGGFSSYGYVFPSSGRVRVPDRVPDELAAAASCALRTVISSIDRLQGLREDASVVIQGAGPVGLFATALLRRRGVQPLIVIGGPSRRLEIARSWGATHTIDIAEVPDAADRRRQVMELTDGYGADVVIEMSGAPSAFTEGLDLVRGAGQYLVVGPVHEHSAPFDPSILTRKHLTLLGNASGSTRHYLRALQFLDSNIETVPWSELISNRYALNDINVAMDRMAAWQEIKPVVLY